MKKQLKSKPSKLHLSTETIRSLTDSSLSGARGGCWVTYVAPCDPENPTPSGNPDYYCG